jgi:hypothetical protein
MTNALDCDTAILIGTVEGFIAQVPESDQEPDPGVRPRRKTKESDPGVRPRCQAQESDQGSDPGVRPRCEAQVSGPGVRPRSQTCTASPEQ